MNLLVLTFGLILTRVGAFVAVMPLFGSISVPRTIKAALVLSLAMLWFGSATAGVTPELLNRPAETSWLAFGLALGREALLGALVGFAFGLYLVPARVAGEFLTQELGLSFGAFLNPTDQSNVSGFTQIFDVLNVIIFLGLDGHHLFLGVLNWTFGNYPLGGNLPGVPIEGLVSAVALTQEWGLMLVAPMVLCMFIVTLVLTLLTRAAPQINLFSVGFPFRLAAGLVIIFLFLPQFLSHLANVLSRYAELLGRLI